MRKALSIIGLALALILAFSSCQKAPFLTFTGQKSFTFKDAGGSETITFSCNRAWTITSSESWLSVSPAKGEANEESIRVTITCAANTTYDSRNATVTIMSEGLTETISVSQDTNYGLMSDPTTFNLTNEAQNIEVEVKANVEYTITIDDACKDWISQVGTKALSSTKLTFSIAANESYDDREGKITISQKGSASSVQPQVITVKQSQTNGLFITTPEYELSNEAHDLTIEVKSNINYEVTSEVDWIKYEASSTKALSATTFTLKVDKNETYDQRVGTVKVKGGGLEGIITITQAENLGLFVSPTEVQISKDAQEVEVEVRANVEYDIIVPEDAKGMITTIKKQGGGDTKALSATKYLFGVSENTTYVGREAAITFKQKDGALSGTMKISQEQTDFLEVSPVKDSISYEGGTLKLDVITNVEYTIVAKDSPDWIKIGEGSKGETKDGLTTYSHGIEVAENENKTRYAELTVADGEGEFSKSFLIAQGSGLVEFEDAIFKAYCVECFDSNRDGEISYREARNGTRIYVEDKSIKSLSGIQNFINLESLSCGNNKLTSLDVSGCTELTYLECQSNKLTSLNVSGCTSLTNLYCGINKLTSLDVSGCTMLARFSFYRNNLTSLDVSKNTALTYLDCWSNQITSLDVSKNTALTGLYCDSNQLTNLDVSNNTYLTELRCNDNNLTSLDVSKNTALYYLKCDNNQLTSLDVSKNTALTGLYCQNNQLTNLDVSKNKDLMRLYCSDNQLTSLDVSKNLYLMEVQCYNNQIITIYVWEGYNKNGYDYKMVIIKDASASFVVIPEE